jgi:hypothetical protein
MTENFDILIDLVVFSESSRFPPEMKMEPVFCERRDAWKVGTLKLPNSIEDL